MFFSKNTKTTGDKAEDIACKHLTKNKINIIERNFKNRSGEIDIIALDKDTLLFVEVKYRKSDSHGQPYENVTAQKQHKIIQTAEYYLQKNPRLSHNDCRFDVISIHNNDITWLKNAFDAS